VLYLVDLFVEPAHQNHGLGRQLLKALCVDHRGPLFTFASKDPRAQCLYEQFSMRPVERYHYLDARVDHLVPWATDVDLVEASPADVATVDAVITRRDRTADIGFATQLGAVWYLAYRRDVCRGVVAVASPTWWSAWHPHGACVGPVVAHDRADVAPIMAAALASLGRVDPAPDIVSLFCPASLDALPALLAAGFEIIDTDLLMSSNPTLIDRRRYVPTVETP
jgi:GNAT superfamily N-acetyltransferase